MSSESVPTTTDYRSVFDLCDAREKRFLYDLMEIEPRVVHDHPLPELHALLLALERMWGGAYKKPPIVPPGLLYYLAVYAAYAHHIPEDIEGWRAGAAHDVYHMLQGFMESVALAIKDGACLKHEADGVYLDLFRIPQWYYDAVMKDQQTVAASD
jgi:hypothetical protein